MKELDSCFSLRNLIDMLIITWMFVYDLERGKDWKVLPLNFYSQDGEYILYVCKSNSKDHTLTLKFH